MHCTSWHIQEGLRLCLLPKVLQLRPDQRVVTSLRRDGGFSADWWGMLGLRCLYMYEYLNVLDATFCTIKIALCDFIVTAFKYAAFTSRTELQSGDFQCPAHFSTANDSLPVIFSVHCDDMQPRATGWTQTWTAGTYSSRKATQAFSNVLLLDKRQISSGLVSVCLMMPQ